MLRRKKAALYFTCSLFIHFVLMLVIWWLVPKSVPEDRFYDKIEIFMLNSKRPPLPKPRNFIEPPTPIVAQEDKPPAPPKPKAGLRTTWQTVEQNAPAAVSKPITRRQENANHTPEVGKELSAPMVGRSVDNVVKNRPTVNSIAQPVAAPSTTLKADYVAPQGETQSIALETDGILKGSGASPTVDAPNIHYGSKRGDALRATSMGNSWGGGSTAGGGSVGGVFVYMMKDVARTLAEATTTKKVDIIFVLDETASMVDNIRGIRAYVDFLFETMKREGHDATFGLVTFTDKTKKYGRTDDLGTFKNWLFKIGVDGGGDIAEAGLDGLMTAVKETKFRKGAQRLILLASDGAFHDADYDGRSAYSLDEVIETLQNERVRVDVIGIDYLPIRQIALATGGTWRAIPGRG